MPGVLVDSNIFIDLLTQDPQWCERSTVMLEHLAKTQLQWEEVPRIAAYHTGQAYARYRRSGGIKSSPLPDFFIGAHAQAMHHTIITRDAARYRTYFPDVTLLTP